MTDRNRADQNRRSRTAQRRTARRVAIFCALAFVAAILTMWARHAAVVARGSTAWGGEALVPVYVIAAWPVWRTMRDWAREARREASR